MIPITASKAMEEEDLQHTVKLSSYIFGCRIPDPTYLGKLFGSKCHHIDIRLYAAWIKTQTNQTFPNFVHQGKNNWLIFLPFLQCRSFEQKNSFVSAEDEFLNIKIRFIKTNPNFAMRSKSYPNFLFNRLFCRKTNK